MYISLYILQKPAIETIFIIIIIIIIIIILQSFVIMACNNLY